MAGMAASSTLHEAAIKAAAARIWEDGVPEDMKQCIFQMCGLPTDDRIIPGHEKETGALTLTGLKCFKFAIKFVPRSVSTQIFIGTGLQELEKFNELSPDDRLELEKSLALLAKELMNQMEFFVNKKILSGSEETVYTRGDARDSSLTLGKMENFFVAAHAYNAKEPKYNEPTFTTAINVSVWRYDVKDLDRFRNELEEIDSDTGDLFGMRLREMWETEPRAKLAGRVLGYEAGDSDDDSDGGYNYDD